MTAFLFLPTSADALSARRVDLDDFASLFREVEEPAGAGRSRVSLRRAGAALLVLALMLADTILIARPDALSACLFKPLHVVNATTI